MTISIGVLTTVAAKNGKLILAYSWQKRNAPRNAYGTKWIPADCWSIVAPKKAVDPGKESLHEIVSNGKKLLEYPIILM